MPDYDFHLPALPGLPVKFDNVIVEGCCNSQDPCPVTRGQKTTFSFTFTPGENCVFAPSASFHPSCTDQDYTYLNQTACGMVESTCVPFPGETFGAMCDCPGCRLEKPCPFKANIMDNITVEVVLSKVLPANVRAPHNGFMYVQCIR